MENANLTSDSLGEFVRQAIISSNIMTKLTIKYFLHQHFLTHLKAARLGTFFMIFLVIVLKMVELVQVQVRVSNYMI